MGVAACRNSENVIFTSDNPSSKSMDIINDMTNSLDFKNYEIIVDRNRQLKKRLGLKSGEILLVLGKGHEDYQEIDGVSPFDDKKIIETLHI